MREASYWVIDPAAREIESYTLEQRTYRMTGRLVGERPAALPPFDDLALDPAALWA